MKTKNKGLIYNLIGLVIMLASIVIAGSIIYTMMNVYNLNKTVVEIENAHNHNAKIIETQQNKIKELEDKNNELEGVLLEAVSEIPKWTSNGVCDPNNNFKSYMDFREITDRSSQQYKWQQKAKTNSIGLRTIDGKPMIALVGYSIGTELKLVLDSGKELDVIVGEYKDNTDCLHPDGSLVEFIVNQDLLSEEVKLKGSLHVIYYGNIVDIKTKEI